MQETLKSITTFNRYCILNKLVKGTHKPYFIVSYIYLLFSVMLVYCTINIRIQYYIFILYILTVIEYKDLDSPLVQVLR